jgi:predicted AAA+ superfamily ATPase
LGASPLSLTGGPSDLYFRWWVGVLEKIVQQDIPSFSPLGSKMAPTLFALLHFLAESPSSTHSLQSIASKLNEVSKTTVFNMFEALKDACLIIEVKEDLDPLKSTNSASKYYFMHPTIRAAILWSLGKFKKDLLLNESSIFSCLFEDIIAFTLIKNMERGKTILQVSSDDSENGADFLVKTSSGKVGLEVCWGKKGASQLRKTMERHSCKFGLSVSKVNSVSIKDNIITIPRELLLFI